jgi:phosphoribosylglycinamide formyltransferase-1
MKSILIFASGNGTNAQNIIDYFRNSSVVVSKIICNYSGAKVLDIARNENLSYSIISKEQLENGEVLNLLRTIEPDLIVLAGFLLKIPKEITDEFRTVNVHPALLPKYGGKGMYGMNVHKAVIDSFDIESGITIHWANENYDEGQIIEQFRCPISSLDTPETLAIKIQNLERDFFPKIISNII